jgi:hypothetical protein
MAQTVSPVLSVPAQAAFYEFGEPTEPGRGPGTSLARFLFFNRDGQGACDEGLFSINQPSNPGEQVAPGQGLTTDLSRKDVTSPVMSRATKPSLDTLPSKGVRPDNMAFLRAAAQTRNERNTLRDKTAPLILSLAVHAALTWDAQSTNHFFHHYPNGFKPVELDPLMRPFAGKALMYPMANLLFGAPIDLLLVKTRRDRKLIRTLTYAAASIWAGQEMRQSIANIRNEHLNPSSGAEAAKSRARTN